jgi:hypothetical protein
MLEVDVDAKSFVLPRAAQFSALSRPGGEASPARSCKTGKSTKPRQKAVRLWQLCSSQVRVRGQLPETLPFF